MTDIIRTKKIDFFEILNPTLFPTEIEDRQFNSGKSRRHNLSHNYNKKSPRKKDSYLKPLISKDSSLLRPRSSSITRRSVTEHQRGQHELNIALEIVKQHSAIVFKHKADTIEKKAASFVQPHQIQREKIRCYTNSTSQTDLHVLPADNASPSIVFNIGSVDLSSQDKLQSVLNQFSLKLESLRREQQPYFSSHSLETNALSNDMSIFNGISLIGGADGEALLNSISDRTLLPKTMLLPTVKERINDCISFESDLNSFVELLDHDITKLIRGSVIENLQEVDSFFHRKFMHNSKHRLVKVVEKVLYSYLNEKNKAERLDDQNVRINKKNMELEAENEKLLKELKALKRENSQLKQSVSKQKSQNSNGEGETALSKSQMSQQSTYWKLFNKDSKTHQTLLAHYNSQELLNKESPGAAFENLDSKAATSAHMRRINSLGFYYKDTIPQYSQADMDCMTMHMMLYEIVIENLMEEFKKILWSEISLNGEDEGTVQKSWSFLRKLVSATFDSKSNSSLSLRQKLQQANNGSVREKNEFLKKIGIGVVEERLDRIRNLISAEKGEKQSANDIFLNGYNMVMAMEKVAEMSWKSYSYELERFISHLLGRYDEYQWKTEGLIQERMMKLLQSNLQADVQEEESDLLVFARSIVFQNAIGYEDRQLKEVKNREADISRRNRSSTRPPSNASSVGLNSRPSTVKPLVKNRRLEAN